VLHSFGVVVIIVSHDTTITTLCTSAVLCMPTAITDVCQLCFAATRVRGHSFENSLKATHFWKSGFDLAFGRKKKARFL